jgi:hypothetical protein
MAGGVGTNEQPRRLLGQILIEMRLISEAQLSHALEEQQETGQFLGEILIAHGWIGRTDVGDALRVQRGQLAEPEPGLGGGPQAPEVGEPATAAGRRMGAWVAQGPTR